jgi:predicted nuclease of predicted toxin-antitoxin system
MHAYNAGMPMLFLLDENISPEVAVIGRRFDLDVVHLQDVLAKGVDDDVVLAYAAAAGRCVVTANDGDFRRLSTRFAVEGQPHAGVLLLPRPPHRDETFSVALAIRRFAALYPDGVPPYFTSYLPRDPRL